MSHWPKVLKNEVIDIIAPSGKIPAEDVEAIRHYLSSQGFKVRIPENLLGPHPFSANDDATRFQHLCDALNAEDSTLIWCVRGGHGVTALMPSLTKLPKPKKQKLIVGFSDICSLHLWVNQRWNWPSLHGPMARQSATGKTDARDLAALHRLWFEGLAGYQIANLKPLNLLAEKAESLEGISAGGCISVLQTSLSTPWQIDGKDKILVLEDINEAPYRIHRALIHLCNTGIFHEAKALVLGDFGETTEQSTDMQKALEDVANHYLPEQGVRLPIFRLAGFGHGPRNQPLPLHTRVRLEKNTLSWD